MGIGRRTMKGRQAFANDGLSSDSDAASPRQTQTDNDASGSPQRVAGRLDRTSPTKSHTGDVDFLIIFSLFFMMGCPFFIIISYSCFMIKLKKDVM